jgi:hypothetical protein
MDTGLQSMLIIKLKTYALFFSFRSRRAHNPVKLQILNIHLKSSKNNHEQRYTSQ